MAVSTALDKVAAFGIGRPTLAPGSGIGSAAATQSTLGDQDVSCGRDRPGNFADFLAGFHTIDTRFHSTEFGQNVPALMGLLNLSGTSTSSARRPAPCCRTRSIYIVSPPTCSGSRGVRTAKASLAGRFGHEHQ